MNHQAHFSMRPEKRSPKQLVFKILSATFAIVAVALSAVKLYDFVTKDSASAAEMTFQSIAWASFDHIVTHEKPSEIQEPDQHTVYTGDSINFYGYAASAMDEGVMAHIVADQAQLQFRYALGTEQHDHVNPMLEITFANVVITVNQGTSIISFGGNSVYTAPASSGVFELNYDNGDYEVWYNDGLVYSDSAADVGGLDIIFAFKHSAHYCSVISTASISELSLATAYDTDDPADDPTGDPTTDPADDPTTDPTTDPTDDPTTDPTDNPTTDPTDNPADDPTDDPTTDPADDSTDDPDAQPVPDTSVPTGTIVPNTGVFTNNGDGANESSLSTIIIFISAGFAIAFFLFSRKYEITKKTHVKGKISFVK